jgi:superoxide dismutase
MGHRYVLPPLEYDPETLEPHISASTIELHHNEHHRTNADGANEALAQLAVAIDLAVLRRPARVSQNEGAAIPGIVRSPPEPWCAQGSSVPEQAECRQQHPNG